MRSQHQSNNPLNTPLHETGNALFEKRRSVFHVQDCAKTVRHVSIKGSLDPRTWVRVCSSRGETPPISMPCSIRKGLLIKERQPQTFLFECSLPAHTGHDKCVKESKGFAERCMIDRSKSYEAASRHYHQPEQSGECALLPGKCVATM